eukprot:CAMPEP_0195521544 /NCGR_PEP_ID=MMETSP0794_2-20130614/18922_1 /TAXON_ID=515487 /ORGANISM="Stephanopyxis turris, Strain CCMP 815" /LENGTH=304 /DNA_ID=CAMNT_0040651119 /DNA_START=152 /DNA_END=1063 /DNA_ORIENTATION=-
MKHILTHVIQVTAVTALAIFVFWTLSGSANNDNVAELIATQQVEQERHLRTRGKIVGGFEILEGRYSYLALLITPDRNFLCGATLIKPGNWVLTAAHCSDDAGSVIFGIHNLSDRYFEEISIVQKFVHPDYDEASKRNDFALFELAKVPKNVAAVKLNVNNIIPEPLTPLTTMGWGRTGSNFYSPVPQEVTIKVMAQDECKNTYQSQGISIVDSMLCAGGRHSIGKDSCQGDSGGPLIKKGANVGEDVLYGVVSFGYGCANAKYPGVYASVGSVVDWIEDKIDGSDNDVELPSGIGNNDVCGTW